MFRLNAARTLTKSVNAVAKRTYAEAAANDFLKLQFALPHETLFAGNKVTQVNLPAKSGGLGILANHVPTVEQLSPGVVEIFEGSNTKKYFVSGGFASVQPDSTLCVTSVEAFPLESFSQENVKSLISDASKNLNSSDEKVAATAAIQLEVLEALQAALK
ncbi:delta subunit of the central stalk of mitochondrial F1F0 ATP synthase, atp16 [Zygosaccharomyces mellis]|uniref:ATP synthase subunit delta, mitochondrial n=1 Tax=Zygosaccharomyces mellis TaxID=42258 RepID=A0A4C2E792_9SACH|nr:delta subunit of the central stalk of mitochondrial F1F0 ATP synthase, atp16 [Zygosaccharomyces mellis]